MMKILYALFFSFIIQNYFKKGVPNRSFTTQGSALDALQKSQLIASFREHFKENHENIISVCLQFYIPKLNQEKCFIPSLLHWAINRVLYKRNH